MEFAALAEYATTKIEPLTDRTGHRRYRCAVRLKDGLYLPCVVLESADAWTDLALRRFEETIADSGPSPPLGAPRVRGWTYRDAVKAFVSGHNQISHYAIASVEPSPFAIPAARLSEVHGETRMSWTVFTGRMRDGREFTFGTTHSIEFFDMPPGYAADDIVAIVSHQESSKEIYGDRQFFTCYVDGL